MKRKIGELILIVFLYLIQCTYGRYIEIGGITPNLLIIIPVLFGFLNGKNEGIYVGLVGGLLYDLLFNNIIGFSALIFMYIGYFAGCYYKKYEESEMLFPLLILFLGNMSFEFIAYIGNFLLHNKLDILYYMTRIVIPEVVYTIFVTIIIYKPLTYLNSKLESKDRRRVKNFD